MFFIGGHTGEMIKLLSGIDLNVYKNREYIVAGNILYSLLFTIRKNNFYFILDTDAMSIQKVKFFEEQSNDEIKIDYGINKIYRSRNVGQSYFSSILTTFIAILNAIPLVIKIKPKLLLINGPGTCVPICLILYLFSKCLFILPKCKIVFIESVCRVKTLSLTGKMLYYLKIADAFLVQWPELKSIYPKSIYIGRLV
jgi:beta-1,4-N-acetylglucosaminyltransferase